MGATEEVADLKGEGEGMPAASAAAGTATNELDPECAADCVKSCPDCCWLMFILVVWSVDE